MSKVQANPPVVNQPTGPWVYFIQDGDGGPIKIGTTAKHPSDRLSGLRTGNARQLRLVLAIPGDKASESAHHVLFATLRIRGEWFHPAPRLMAYIEDHKVNNPQAFVGESALSQGELRAMALTQRLAEMSARVKDADEEIARLRDRVQELEDSAKETLSAATLTVPLADVVRSATRAAILCALKASSSRAEASRRLGVSTATLWRKMESLGITDPMAPSKPAKPVASNPGSLPHEVEVNPITFSGKSRSQNLADLKAATRARLGRR